MDEPAPVTTILGASNCCPTVRIPEILVSLLILTFPITPRTSFSSVK